MITFNINVSSSFGFGNVSVYCPSTHSQTKSELAAKDDNLETADLGKDKDDKTDAEKEEQINEQGDQVRSDASQTLPFAFCAPQSMISARCLFQRDFDENEVDPYHGQQDTRPEPEAIDLPEELNLDQEEARDDGSDEGDGDCGQ